MGLADVGCLDLALEFDPGGIDGLVLEPGHGGASPIPVTRTTSSKLVTPPDALMTASSRSERKPWRDAMSRSSREPARPRIASWISGVTMTSS